MNFVKTLYAKGEILNEYGQAMIDLLQKTFEPTGFVNIFQWMTVTKDLEMRPDVISKIIYKSIDNAEIFMKFNGISNPFTIEFGDLLIFPNLRGAAKQFKNRKSAAQKNDIRSQYLDPTKSPTADPRLAQFSQRGKPKGALDGRKFALPPNFAGFNDKEVIIEGGKIKFGPNVTRTNPKDTITKQPISKSRFLSQLIKNRISKKVN